MNAINNLDECKSYATLANLEKALAKLGFDSLPRLICYTSTGRATAVFFSSESNAVIFHGFKWVHGFDSWKPAPVTAKPAPVAKPALTVTPCPDCDGLGAFSSDYSRSVHRSDAGSKTCSRCGGSGKI